MWGCLATVSVTRQQDGYRNHETIPWNHSLFGCCDSPGNCLYSLVCPCLVAGGVAEHVGESSLWRSSGPLPSPPTPDAVAVGSNTPPLPYR